MGGGSSKGPASIAENQGVKSGNAEYTDIQPGADSRVPGGRGSDAKVKSQGKGGGQWTATLPKGIREAIRASQRKKLPRGYEERLRRYSKSLK